MLIVGPNMSGFTLAAGEPFLLWVELQEMDGSASDLSNRAFVLTFYRDDRSVVGKIDGEVVSGETFVRFEEDGRFCDGMFNQVVYAELDERLRYGRNRIAGGRVFVTTSALTVASLDNASIGEFAMRVLVREANPVGDKVTFTQSVVAYAPPNATPAPSVTAKPTIASDGSPQVGETMTGNSGTYQNGSVASRAWLLNGSAISGANGATYVPQATGSLVYREVVSGAGGQINADSDPVTVASAAPAPDPATFTVSNPSFVDYQQFSRTTKTGGYANNGTATIPAWPISVTAAGAIYARLVAKGDPNRADGTVIQDAWLLNASVATSATSIDVAGCGCGAAWFEVQLSGSASGPWQSAPNQVKLGVGVAIVGIGQSIIQRMMQSIQSGPTSVGVSLNPYTSYLASYVNSDGSGTPTPTWVPVIDTGVYNGAGFAQLGDRLQKALGVNVIIGAHVHGGIAAANLLKLNDASNGSDFGYVTAIMNALKAWEYTWWFQGHTDSSNGMAARDYQCYLRWYFGYAAFKNFWGAATRGLVMGIPNTTDWGTDAQKNEIRTAAYRWVKKEGAAACTNGCYYANTYTMPVLDGTHPGQDGAKQLGDLAADALISAADAPAGDDQLAAPAAMVFTGAGSETYSAAGKFLPAALNGGNLAGTNSPPIGPVTWAAWVKVAAGTGGGGVAFRQNNGVYAQYDGHAMGVATDKIYKQDTGPYLDDAAWHYGTVEVDATPYDQTKGHTTRVLVDGVASTGGTAANSFGLAGQPFVRAYSASGSYRFDGATMSEFALYNKLGVPVPTAALAGTEDRLYTVVPLNGSAAALL